MTTKEILHQVLLGMDAYISCGVPGVYWELAVQLTQEVYGKKGVELLRWAHKENKGHDNIVLHVIDVWDYAQADIAQRPLADDDYVGPKELIERLESLVTVDINL